MCEFEEIYPENIKRFLLSKESQNSSLITRQNRIIENISKHQNLDEHTNIEYYNEMPYDKNAFLEKCEEILLNIPISYIKDEYINIINSIDVNINNIDNIFINYGDRISLDENNNKKFEEWRNILSNISGILVSFQALNFLI